MISIRQLTRKLPIWLGVASLILSLDGCKFFGSSPGTYSVKRVNDGDTIVVKGEGDRNITVRFACMDAPEVPHSQKERQSRKLVDKDQYKWGFKAQARVQQLIKQGDSRIILTVTDTDQYGRKVGEVRLPNGTLIQQVLIQEGLAMVYRPYLKNCPSASAIAQAEAEAKKSGRGVWGDPKFTPPWEYRRIK